MTFQWFSNRPAFKRTVAFTVAVGVIGAMWCRGQTVTDPKSSQQLRQLAELRKQVDSLLPDLEFEYSVTVSAAEAGAAKMNLLSRKRFAWQQSGTRYRQRTLEHSNFEASTTRSVDGAVVSPPNVAGAIEADFAFDGEFASMRSVPGQLHVRLSQGIGKGFEGSPRSFLEPKSFEAWMNDIESENARLESVLQVDRADPSGQLKMVVIVPTDAVKGGFTRTELSYDLNHGGLCNGMVVRDGEGTVRNELTQVELRAFNIKGQEVSLPVVVEYRSRIERGAKVFDRVQRMEISPSTVRPLTPGATFVLEPRAGEQVVDALTRSSRIAAPPKLASSDDATSPATQVNQQNWKLVAMWSTFASIAALLLVWTLKRAQTGDKT